MPEPPMTYSDGLVAFVQEAEGFRARAYQDNGWAIGFGTHVPGIDGNTVCTMAQAVAWQKEKLDEVAGNINQYVTIQLEQYQFDALCSFDYNEGDGAFDKSTLRNDINAGNFEAAANEFPKWDKKTDASGQLVVDPGLHSRRLKEQAMFLNTPYTQQVTG